MSLFRRASSSSCLASFLNRYPTAIVLADWEQKIEYWEIHDLDVATAVEAPPVLKWHVDDLFERLSQNPVEKWNLEKWKPGICLQTFPNHFPMN